MGQPDYRGARGSNAGDDFHELWALRQALALLDQKSGLTAVSVEGLIAEDESGTPQDTWDGVDCTLYYGGDATKADRIVITGSDKGGSEATEVGADARGDVLAVGFIANSETGSDFAVVKLDGLSGTVLWTKTISGTAGALFDMAHAVTVDLAGDVIAAGYLANSLTGDDFTVIKLDGKRSRAVAQDDQWYS